MREAQHLSSLTLALSLPEKAHVTSAWANSLAPFLQGVLMESIDQGYASWLHAQPFNPYSQYCLVGAESKTLSWHVNTLTDEAFRQIILPLQRLDSFRLRGVDMEVDVEGRTVTTASVKELTDMIYHADAKRQKVEFVTPTAFKQSGSYVFLPSVKLIFQNLLMRYFQVYEGSNEVDVETVDYLEKYVHVSSYQLRSQYFDHAAYEKRKIPGYTGSVGLSFKGPQPIVGLAQMLLRFGEYAGVGIKTSMGMGGIRCS